MEGIKAAAEARDVYVTVHDLDWADDELVADLGSIVRQARSYAWDPQREEEQLQLAAGAAVRNACKELFTDDIEHDRIDSYVEVKLNSLYGPGGGWPTVTVSGPIVFVDRLMESYFEPKSQQFRETADAG